MWPQSDKLYGIVRESCAIGTFDYTIIAFFAAYLAIQVNDEEILFYQAGVGINHPALKSNNFNARRTVNTINLTMITPLF